MKVPFSYNLRNLWVRKTSTGLTIVGIGFVVWIFIMVMSVAQGLQKKMSQTGETDNLLITTKEAQYEFSSVIEPADLHVLRTYEGFQKDDQGRPLLSLETLFGAQQPPGVEPPIVFVRGVDADRLMSVHTGMRLTKGRVFRPLSREVVVGAMLAEKYPRLHEGGTVRIGKYDWKIVGVFDAKGGAFESIFYADRQDLKTHLRLNRDFSVTAKMQSPQAMRGVMAALEGDKRVSLRGRPEQAYYEEQAQTARQMEILAYLVSIIMAVGAVFGAINTMYAAVAGRSREIGTLRALGFQQPAILQAFLGECLVLAFLGGMVGCLLGLATAGAHFDLPEQGVGLMRVRAIPTWRLLGGGMAFALLMGAIGGWFPAWHASKLEIVAALRKA